MKNRQTLITAISLILMVFLSIVSFSSCSDSGGNATLDGKSFMTLSFADGQPNTGELELLTFTNGEFNADQCYLWGFEKANYTAKKDGDQIMFDAAMISPAEGSMHWTGNVKGDVLNGTMIWHKEGQNDVHYSYTSANLAEAKLEGKSFLSPMQMGDSLITETISFNHQNFESPSCYQWGFSATPYRAYSTNNKTYFQCMYKSDKEGLMLFNGMIEGNQMTANQYWHKEGQTDEYTEFKGTMQ